MRAPAWTTGGPTGEIEARSLVQRHSTESSILRIDRELEEETMKNGAREGLSRIGQIAITVKDLARAVAFYRDVLGMRFLFEAPPKLAFFDCGGVRLMLAPPEKPEYDHPASILYYVVTDIQAEHDHLRRRGVVFAGHPHLVAKLPDHELWLDFFWDSEGNTLALMSEVRAV
jgi:methylmalonyl-CoA/ethylmalonyl-CoA epimerase